MTNLNKKFILLVIIISKPLYSLTWKYTIIHPSGKEETYRIEENNKKVFIPIVKWKCSVYEQESNYKDIVAKNIICDYGNGTVMVRSTCGLNRPSKYESHRTLHLYDWAKPKNKNYYRFSLWCE